MTIIATIAVIIVAVIHIAIAVGEMFLWKKPSTSKALKEKLKFTEEIVCQVDPIVKNAGLYNAFIAAGLIWGTFAASNPFSIQVFFLICVIIAGIFGAMTLIKKTLVLQTLPAAIALTLISIAHSQL
jgi:putative membrane protein